MGYAAQTSVSPEKTKAEIESTLRKYGADQFASGWDAGRAFVMFRAKDRTIRFVVAFPDPGDKRFRYTPAGKRRLDSQAQAEYDQAVRAVWRRLLLCIRAKLESVATGIETLEEAFLAQILLPDGETVGAWAGREIPKAIRAGTPLPSLLALPPAERD